MRVQHALHRTQHRASGPCVPEFSQCVDTDLRHGAVLLPPGDEPELHFRESLCDAIGPYEIRKPGVPDGMGVNGFGDIQFFG